MSWQSLNRIDPVPYYSSYPLRRVQDYPSQSVPSENRHTSFGSPVEHLIATTPSPKAIITPKVEGGISVSIPVA